MLDVDLLLMEYTENCVPDFLIDLLICLWACIKRRAEPGKDHRRK